LDDVGHHEQIQQEKRGPAPAGGFRLAQPAVRLWETLGNREPKQSLIFQFPLCKTAFHESLLRRTSTTDSFSPGFLSFF
jgi:hypothetical protein